ncbi:MAG TPA: alpha/beta hydrolase family protein [Chloroflexota bacterium]
MLAVLEGTPGFAGRDQMYWSFVVRQVQEHAWRRQEALRELRTAADWAAWGRRVRATLREAVGPFPERNPLNPRTLGTIQRDGYRIEKLVIESRPGYLVPINLYLPDRIDDPLPAVINPIGHWAGGKHEPHEQSRSIGLARLGFVSLTWDPIGQGERSEFLYPGRDESRYGPNPACAEHAAASTPCFLLGSTVVNYMAWDGIRCIDYLQCRPEVDGARIGCTGCSGGSTYTQLIGALDERVGVSVPVCSVMPWDRCFADGVMGDPCQDPVRTFPDFLDVGDLLMAVAPGAVRILAARRDYLPPLFPRTVYAELRECYRALGVPERVSLVEFDCKHEYNRSMRESMYAWMIRWLKGGDETPSEPEHATLPAERLWCSPSGQMLRGLTDQTIVRQNRARAERLAHPPARGDDAETARAESARVGEALRRCTGYEYRPGDPEPRTLARETCGDLLLEKLVFESEPDLIVPGLLFRPPGDGRLPVVLYLNDEGKAVEAGDEGLIRRLARSGRLVLAIDLRGWGETRWTRHAQLTSDYFGVLGQEAMMYYANYMLGRWTLTQRVQDVARALDVLTARPDVDPSRIALVARGAAGIVALHAAALDERIAALAIHDTLASYREIVNADHTTHNVSGIVPGALLHYDLPDIVLALAPRPVFVGAPRDALGAPLAAVAAEGLYAPARDAHTRLGGSLHLETSADRARLLRAIESWVAR